MKTLIRSRWPFIFPLIIVITMILTLLAFTGQQARAQQPSATYQVYLPLVVGGSGHSIPTPTPTVSPTPAPLVEKSIFGLNAAALDEENGVVEVLNAGASWTHTRQAVNWADVEPVQGQRNWNALAALNSELQTANGLGLRVILTVENTPAWAHASGIPCGPVLPEKLPALAAFLHDLVQRYSAAPYHVKTWELWPEPDIAGNAGCWGDPADPGYGGDDYAAMLAAVYPQIKSADPDAQVLVGGLRLECDPNNSPGGKDCSSSNFIEGILQAGGGAFFDGVSFHASDGFAVYDLPWGTAYQYSNYNWHSYWHDGGPVVIAKTRFLRSLLTEYNVAGKALYNTQSAILCASCQAVPVFETAKAGYVAQVYATAMSLGLEVNLWESLVGWQNSGLMSPELTALPAYRVFQTAREQIGPATYTGEVLSSDVGGAAGIRGFKFTHEDGRQVWVLWYASVTESSRTVTFVSPPNAAWDMLGKSLDLSGDLVVGVDPIYVEWMP
jgi:hypothetical protein